LDTATEVMTKTAQVPGWSMLTAPEFLACYLLVDMILLGLIIRLFSVRWRVAY